MQQTFRIAIEVGVTILDAHNDSGNLMTYDLTI